MHLRLKLNRRCTQIFLLFLEEVVRKFVFRWDEVKVIGVICGKMAWTKLSYFFEGNNDE